MSSIDDRKRPRGLRGVPGGPVDEARIAAAGELALRHRLRAMDALHLACALSLGPAGETVMVSADAELLAAAEGEGMRVVNPGA